MSPQKVDTKLEVDPYFLEFGHVNVLVVACRRAPLPPTEIFSLAQHKEKKYKVVGHQIILCLLPNFDNQDSKVCNMQHFAAHA